MIVQEIWNDAVIPALVTLATAAFSILAGAAVSALRRWAANQEAQWKGAIMAEVALAVEVAVAATNQTFVDDIKAGRDDGHLTPDEAVAALKRAKDVAIEQLGKSGMAALARLTGSEASSVVLLYNMIEAAVRRAKHA